VRQKRKDVSKSERSMNETKIQQPLIQTMYKVHLYMSLVLAKRNFISKGERIIGLEHIINQELNLPTILPMLFPSQAL